MNFSRLSTDDRYILSALVMSAGSTCRRRRVGCYLTDWRGKVLSTGFNGPASRESHCIDKPCSGSEMASGSGLDHCLAIHAEQNALMQCPDVQTISTAYCTTAPCVHCIKMLMNTSCSRIVYCEEYPHSEISRELWLSNPSGGRLWIKYEPSSKAAGNIVESVKQSIDLLLV